MNYNLMPLKYFIDVVQTGGFISAAQRNYVSETAVSSAIKKLEDSLGHRLLNRSANRSSLTPVGEQFYKRAVDIINSYNEIWHQPDTHPDKLLRIHFLQGLENDAAMFANKLPSKYRLSLDEEIFDSSISRLVKGYYDLLIGFQLAFSNNNKIKTFPLRTISFDLLFNTYEVKKYDTNLKKLAQNSKLYLQYWHSTGISDIQTAMLKAYNQDKWSYREKVGINSFSAACLNVNFRGGLTMVPENFKIPNNCESIYRYSPKHLNKLFKVVAAVNSKSSIDFLTSVINSIR
ncbi:LysR family transcriptional regulator [Oenococcus sp. UCMA 17063]|nr:LysR family transcriptional regulator [Oenococcus sp. UCMA 17063]